MTGTSYGMRTHNRPMHDSRWERLTAFMRQRPMLVAMLAPLAGALLVAWVDYASTWEFSLFVFYAVPIIMAVWWAGRQAGYGMALICGVMWWASNYDTHPYETTFGYVWATLSRVVFFSVVAYAVTAVRNRQEADAARIQALEERRQLEEDLVAVSEHEQQRIGQDLHDGLCQQLAAIGLAARSLADDLHQQQSISANDAELIQQSIQQAVEEARGLARGIFPVHVDSHGLAVALTELSRTTSRLTGVVIDVVEEGDVQISPPEAAMHLYRIAQEAVANAVRHGGAQCIRIRVEGGRDMIRLTISDDGKGFPAARKGGGMGLRTMRYRAQVMGATLAFSPTSKDGAWVRCDVPVFRS
jgi:signal transduction histidine kinase